MREWLSGGAPPCQGGGRGFDPRLALEKRTIPNRYRSFFRALAGLESSMSTLRSGPRSPRSPGPRAPSRASFIYSGSLDFTGFPLFLCGCRPAPTCTQSIYCIGYNAFSNKFCVSSVASLVTKAAGEHPKINLLLAAKAAYGCQGTRYGTVLSKAS